MNKYVKFTLKAGGIFFLILLIALIIYIIYFLTNYYRIPDYKVLAADNPQNIRVEKNIPYKITSFNIGFGAYSDDFSFFLDGGTESVAFSKDAVTQNINGSIAIAKETSSDFFLFQEVDINGTRSYHVNQYEMLQNAFPQMSSVFAVNFDSPFIFFPFHKPHGKNLAGIATFSTFEAANAMRRSLPIDDNWNKFLDLDRCYSYTEYPIDSEKSLFVYNVHLSAYSFDPTTVQNQVRMLVKDINTNYEAGHYVIVGGDFNQDVLGNSAEVFGFETQDLTWAQPFDTSLLPEAFSMAKPSNSQTLAPTSRLADTPYQKGKSLILAIDGFIVSDNVKVLELSHIDAEFLYSDHNPVSLTFSLE